MKLTFEFKHIPGRMISEQAPVISYIQQMINVRLHMQQMYEEQLSNINIKYQAEIDLLNIDYRECAGKSLSQVKNELIMELLGSEDLSDKLKKEIKAQLLSKNGE